MFEFIEQLNEATRNDLLAKSKSSKDGNKRFKRRTKSRVANSVREFNSIDMNKLFKKDILSVNINVNGETDNYVVRIAFAGFLEILSDELEKSNGVLSLKLITKALTIGFNKDDIYINCSCPDSYFRYSYQNTKNGVNTTKLDGKKIIWKDKAYAQGLSKKNYSNVSSPQSIPAPITNPKDDKGSTCKHVLLVLSNNSWLMKVASVIYNYIKYMEKNYQRLYADVIYPAIYGKEYEEPVQLDLFDNGRKYAKTSKDIINKANDANGRDEKGHFAKGNKEGKKFSNEYNPSIKGDKELDQISLFDDEEQ